MAATEVFFAGAAFLVTPVGFAALVVDFFGPLFAPVLAVARFLVVVAVVSVTVGKILGLELPTMRFSGARRSYALRHIKLLAATAEGYREI